MYEWNPTFTISSLLHRDDAAPSCHRSHDRMRVRKKTVDRVHPYINHLIVINAKV